jgi:MFS family permease
MYGGVVIGNLLFGWLGDKFGRRIIILVAWFLGTFGVLMIGLSRDYGMLLFSLIFTGITLWPPLNLAIILVNE